MLGSDFYVWLAGAGLKLRMGGTGISELITEYNQINIGACPAFCDSSEFLWKLSDEDKISAGYISALPYTTRGHRTAASNALVLW